MKNRPPNRVSFIFVGMGIIFLGAALRLWDLDAGSLWIDEYLTAIRVEGSLGDLIDRLSGVGNQLPLYYLLMLPFPTGNEFLLRYPSVLLGILGIAVMIAVMRRLYSSRSLALAAGSLLALNPYHIWLSRNARTYPLVIVLSLLVSYFFLRILTGKATRRDWFGYAASSIAAYITHFFMLFLPLAQFVILVAYLRDSRARFWRWVAVQAAAGSLVLAWVVYQSQQPIVAIAVNWIPQPGLPDLPLTLWNMTIGYPLGAAWYVTVGAVVAVGLLVSGSFGALLRRHNDPRFMYWGVLAWLPLVSVFIVSIIIQPAYVDRYFALSLPAILLLLVYGLAHLPRTLSRVTLAVLLMVMAANVGGELSRRDHLRADWGPSWRILCPNVSQTRGS